MSLIRNGLDHCCMAGNPSSSRRKSSTSRTKTSVGVNNVTVTAHQTRIGSSHGADSYGAGMMNSHGSVSEPLGVSISIRTGSFIPIAFANSGPS